MTIDFIMMGSVVVEHQRVKNCKTNHKMRILQSEYQLK